MKRRRTALLVLLAVMLLATASAPGWAKEKREPIEKFRARAFDLNRSAGAQGDSLRQRRAADVPGRDLFELLGEKLDYPNPMLEVFQHDLTRDFARRAGASEQRHQRLMQLRKQLDAAVVREEYEVAAQLRDDIQGEEEKLG